MLHIPANAEFAEFLRGSAGGPCPKRWACKALTLPYRWPCYGLHAISTLYFRRVVLVNLGGKFRPFPEPQVGELVQDFAPPHRLVSFGGHLTPCCDWNVALLLYRGVDGRSVIKKDQALRATVRRLRAACAVPRIGLSFRLTPSLAPHAKLLEHLSLAQREPAQAWVGLVTPRPLRIAPSLCQGRPASANSGLPWPSMTLSPSS
jgi:hypothetical protein